LPSRQSAVGGLAAQASVFQSHGWMLMGALQLVGVHGVRLSVDVPALRLQPAVLQAVFQDSQGSRLATQSELGSQLPGTVGSA
jgi:hypothetical protein